MALEFNGSKGRTLGIEIEIQLVDSEEFSLKDTSDEVVAGLKELEGAIKHELLRSTLEINTCVCSSLEDAEADLFRKFEAAMAEASRHSTRLCCAGTHPFSRWKDQTVTDNPRYRRLVENLQMVARRFNIFGLHVHTGISDGERCIYIMSRMLSYLPHLLALSANSPFWEGHNTGLMSYRTKVFENLPVAGLPFYFRNWHDYVEVVDGYLRTGTIETIRELWWDIRPHPDFGTLEVRICDAPSTIRETLGIAALIQSLVSRFDREYEAGMPFERPHPFIVRENKWRAARYGLGAEFINEDGKTTVDARRAILGLLDTVDLDAKRLGAYRYLLLARDILDRGEGAVRQLEQWKRSCDLKGVVRYLCDELDEEVLSRHAGGGYGR